MPESKETNKLSSAKNTIIFIVFVLVVIGLLTAISGRRSERIPDNETHINLTDVVYCLSCHGPGREYARSESHPPKDECVLCHKTKRQRKYK